MEDDVDFVSRTLSTAKFLMGHPESAAADVREKQMWDAASRKVVIVAEEREPNKLDMNSITHAEHFIRVMPQLSMQQTEVQYEASPVEDSTTPSSNSKPHHHHRSSTSGHHRTSATAIESADIHNAPDSSPSRRSSVVGYRRTSATDPATSADAFAAPNSSHSRRSSVVGHCRTSSTDPVLSADASAAANSSPSRRSSVVGHRRTSATDPALSADASAAANSSPSRRSSVVGHRRTSATDPALSADGPAAANSSPSRRSSVVGHRRTSATGLAASLDSSLAVISGPQPHAGLERSHSYHMSKSQHQHDELSSAAAAALGDSNAQERRTAGTRTRRSSLVLMSDIHSQLTAAAEAAAEPRDGVTEPRLARARSARPGLDLPRESRPSPATAAGTAAGRSSSDSTDRYCSKSRHGSQVTQLDSQAALAPSASPAAASSSDSTGPRVAHGKARRVSVSNAPPESYTTPTATAAAGQTGTSSELKPNPRHVAISAASSANKAPLGPAAAAAKRDTSPEQAARHHRARRGSVSAVLLAGLQKLGITEETIAAAKSGQTLERSKSIGCGSLTSSQEFLGQKLGLYEAESHTERLFDPEEFKPKHEPKPKTLGIFVPVTEPPSGGRPRTTTFDRSHSSAAALSDGKGLSKQHSMSQEQGHSASALASVGRHSSASAAVIQQATAAAGALQGHVGSTSLRKSMSSPIQPTAIEQQPMSQTLDRSRTGKTRLAEPVPISGGKRVDAANASGEGPSDLEFKPYVPLINKLEERASKRGGDSASAAYVSMLDKEVIQSMRRR